MVNYNGIGSVRCVRLGQGVFVSGSNDGRVRIWSTSQDRREDLLESEEEEEKKEMDNGHVVIEDSTESNIHHHELIGHEGAVTCIDLDVASDKTVVSGSADRTIREWDINTGQNTLKIDVWWSVHGAMLPPNPNQVGTVEYIGALQFWGPALVTGTSDGVVRMWDCRFHSITVYIFICYSKNRSASSCVVWASRTSYCATV